MSIILEGVSKKYGKQFAIKNISFELKKGEIAGFIGPNGSGKSTTMKVICGILPSDEGNITVNGINVKENNREVKKHIGYLPEHNPLYHEMYVKEYLLFVAGLYNLTNKHKITEEIIELTGLKPEYKKRIGKLSKGYKQRVGLAQALIHDPDILILDEPTTGLDPNQIIEIRKLIQNLARKKTVLLSTHILQEVEAICDKVIIINKGVVVADQSPAQINTDVQKTQIILVEFEEEIKKDIIEKIPNIDSYKKISASSWLLECITANEKEVRKAVFDFSVQNNLTILAMQKQDKNLEESFKEIIKRSG